MQCKDIPDQPILEMLSKNPGKWHNWYFGNELDVSRAMPTNVPDRLKLAKMLRLIHRGVVFGCPCGCRGDFVITEKGFRQIGKDPPANKVFDDVAGMWL